MRQDPAWSHVSYGTAMGLGPHIARTFAEAEHVDRVRGLVRGADDYVTRLSSRPGRHAR